MVKSSAVAIAARVRLAPSGDELEYFRANGADLKAMAEEGDSAASAELARRKANRALKSAAKSAAAPVLVPAAAAAAAA